jgi:hypothetical protein
VPFKCRDGFRNSLVDSSEFPRYKLRIFPEKPERLSQVAAPKQVGVFQCRFAAEWIEGRQPAAPIERREKVSAS